VRHVPTLYTAHGRWLEWLFVAGFLFIVVWALFARRAAGISRSPDGPAADGPEA